MNAQEFQKKFGISHQTMVNLLKQNLIPGAKKESRTWDIPDDFGKHYVIEQDKSLSGSPIVIRTIKKGHQLKSKTIPDADRIRTDIPSGDEVNKRVDNLMNSTLPDRLKELGREIYKEVLSAESHRDKSKAFDAALKLEGLFVKSLIDLKDPEEKKKKVNSIMEEIKADVKAAKTNGRN